MRQDLENKLLNYDTEVQMCHCAMYDSYGQLLTFITEDSVQHTFSISELTCSKVSEGMLVYSDSEDSVFLCNNTGVTGVKEEGPTPRGIASLVSQSFKDNKVKTVHLHLNPNKERAILSFELMRGAKEN